MRYVIQEAIYADGAKYYFVCNKNNQIMMLNTAFGFKSIKIIFDYISRSYKITWSNRKHYPSTKVTNIHIFDSWEEFLNFDNTNPEYFI